MLALFVAVMLFATVPAAPPARAGGPPFFVVDIDGALISGYGWQANSQVVITIDIPTHPGNSDVTRVVSTSGAGAFAEYIGNEYRPRPEDIVTVGDGVFRKTHVVTDIWAAASDEAANTVSGRSAPGTEIRTWVIGLPNKTVSTNADAAGRWSVDYSSVWNLGTGTTIGIRGYDPDGDATENHAVLPVDPDVDQDTIPNMVDNCPRRANVTQYDGDGDGTGAMCDHVDRVWGADRYWTAAAVAELAFEDADTVFLALGTNFPDALVAAAAGGYRDAPVLLVNAASVPQATISELQRLSPQRAYIVGGTAVIDPVVDELVRSYVPHVSRLAGANRYATAVVVSKTIFPTATRAFIATGENVPDALVAAAAAGYMDAPVLLTPHDHVPQIVRDELTRLGASTIYVVGGTSALSATVAQELASFGTVKRLAGADRYETAMAVEYLFGMNHRGVFLAYGGNFPDALVAAAAGGHLLAPVVLVTHDSIPSVVMSELDRRWWENVWLVGGPAAIDDSVAAAIP